MQYTDANRSKPLQGGTNRHLQTVVTLAACLVTGASQSQVRLVPGWGAPVFEENFDGNGINYGVWQVADWPANNNGELQYYHPNQVRVNNGALSLHADRDWNWSFGREWNSGNIRTWQEWSYGRVEVRARVPWGRGFWPAIWLLPRTAPWPAGGELDIMEARGDLPWRVSSAVHWGWDEPNHRYVSQAFESGANFQDGYHTYAMEWDVGTVAFFVDGVEHMRVYEPAVGIPGTPKSIVLNLAVGGNYPGYPDGSTPNNAQFDVDYVRVWQRPEYVAPPVSRIKDPGFESNDGALLDWERFGNTNDNVISDFGTPRDGARSLKLFGQFDGAENYSGALQNIPITGRERFTATAFALTRSEDAISGTANEALMKVEFYSEPGAEYGSPAFITEYETVIADAASPTDTWSAFELEGMAPRDAVEARVTLLFKQDASNPGGSVFVDSVTFNTTICRADANNDGMLSPADFTAWILAFNSQAPECDQNGDGLCIPGDFSSWVLNFNNGC
ncbi:MAG: glycoside hydrolase family 16 protein [Planctomycetota bacterium]